MLITTVGKNDAAFGPADDAAAIMGPVRARFDPGPYRLDRVRPDPVYQLAALRKG